MSKIISHILGALTFFALPITVALAFFAPSYAFFGAAGFFIFLPLNRLFHKVVGAVSFKPGEYVLLPGLFLLGIVCVLAGINQYAHRPVYALVLEQRAENFAGQFNLPQDVKLDYAKPYSLAVEIKYDIMYGLGVSKWQLNSKTPFNEHSRPIVLDPSKIKTTDAGKDITRFYNFDLGDSFRPQSGDYLFSLNKSDNIPNNLVKIRAVKIFVKGAGDTIVTKILSKF